MTTIPTENNTETVASTGSDTAPRRRGRIIGGLLPYIGVMLFLAAVLSRLVAGTLDGSVAFADAVTYLIGYAGVGAGISHIFFGARISKTIGFAKSPYELEVGFADLAMGITALVAGYFAPEFSLAVILVSGLFRIGCGFGHIRSMIRDRNFAANNTAILGVNFVVPAFLIVAYVLWAR